MQKYIIIAGPQSSGKSTLLKYLKEKHPNWHFIEEKNPASVTGKKDFGAINSESELERKIIEEDILHIKKINRKNKKVIIIESDIFHYVYARYFIGKKEANDFFKQYLQAHQGYDPLVIFIKTTPSISWERRKPEYIKRIKNKRITDEKTVIKHLDQYKKIIEDLYPLWLKCYDKIPFKKLTIENLHGKKAEFLKKAEKIILSLSQKSP